MNSSAGSKSPSALQAFVLGSGLVSSIVTLSAAAQLTPGYELVAAYPIVFLVVYVVTWARVQVSQSRSPFLLVIYTVIQWLRFILLPPVLAFAGPRAGTPVVSPRVSSLETAAVLILLELVIDSVLIYWLVRGQGPARSFRQEMTLRGNRLVYGTFLLLSVGVYFITAGRTSILHVAVLPAGTGERVGDLTDTSLVVLRQVVLVALFVAFMWAVATYGPRYRRTGKRSFLLVPLGLAVANVVLIVGERRSAQVLTAFCVTLVLVQAYPELRRRILWWVWGAASAVLLLMTLYKVLGVFQYQSYGDAVAASQLDVAWLSQTLQTYFAGPQMLAAVIDYAGATGPSLHGLMFDMTRSTVPISFLVKGDGTLSAVAFNHYLYAGKQDTGQVISSLGYGYMFLGVAGFWFFSAVNAALAYIAEQALWRSQSYEALFVWAYVFMRLALNIFANTPALISGASMMLATAGLLFAIARLAAPERGVEVGDEGRPRPNRAVLVRGPRI